MRQISIVLKISNFSKYSYSILSHIYEIGLYLADSGLNVIYWINANEEKLLDLDLKYMQTLPIIFCEEDLPKSYILLTDVFDSTIENLDKIKKIFFVNNPFLEKTLLNNYDYKEVESKSYILYSNQIDSSFLNTDMGYTFYESNRAYEYDYGIFYKYLLNTHKYTNKHYLANTQTSDVINNVILDYVKSNNIQYSVVENIASHNIYSSLLYANHYDFFTRLPFEFSLANKKVVMFDCDSYFRKLTKHQLWNHPYVIEDIPTLNLDLNMLKNN